MRNTNSSYEVVELSIDQIDQDFINDWANLNDRCLDAIVYLDPAFIFPALKYLAHKHVILTVLYDTDNEDHSLVGLGLFEFCLGTFRFPLPYLVVYKSTHSFLSGLVIDRDKTEEVVSVLLEYLARKYWYTFGVRFIDFAIEDRLGLILQNSDRTKWYKLWDYQRVIYTIPQTTDESWSGGISKNSLKNYRRHWRELHKLGSLE